MQLHLYGLAQFVKLNVIASMPCCSTDTHDLPSPSVVAAWVHLMRAQRIVLAAIEQDLKAAGLPPLGWYDVLLELVRADEGKLRPYEIEERTLLAQHNLSRLLDRMERNDLVRREAFADDRRGRWVIITDAGRAMQRRIWSVCATAIQIHIGEKLNDAHAAQLAELLAVLSKVSSSRPA